MFYINYVHPNSPKNKLIKIVADTKQSYRILISTMFEFIFLMYYLYYLTDNYRPAGLDAAYFISHLTDDIPERLECVLYLINLA